MLIVPRENTRLPLPLDQSLRIHPLDDRHKEEVLSFLGIRPLNTFIMSSWIRDNGLDSSFNRGSFYGYRNAAHRLEGVALIGHITLFETEAATSPDPTLRAGVYEAAQALVATYAPGARLVTPNTLAATAGATR